MGNGTRILLNADGIITDWAKQHFEPVSSPLSAIANPKVAFDLFTPVDNSRHGFTVQQGVQKLKAYGLQFPSVLRGARLHLQSRGSLVCHFLLRSD
ncbi:hypothetical protein IE990_00910 [Klebsiella pneumoniae]|uniref:Uncharacterized protein n=1 Tax=Klebsiella pneumoniae TaxID=573 RepID=A0A927DE81_KLEPN|nr:hypothetical protein [Klebsiella pneumoniae]